MSIVSSSNTCRALRAVEHIATEVVDAASDRQRGNRTAIGLIGGYAVLWWVYALIAKSTQDIHPDMGEIFAWSRHPAFGYVKHPPFPGWVGAVWFAVFPSADWSFYLLSAANIGVGLWFVWLIATRVLEADKRISAVLLLTLTPIFSFQALKFNSNALLLATCPAATWSFLRSMQERTLSSGALAGLAAGFAMLTKYWAVFLVVGFIAAAMLDPRRGRYLRSPAPWAAFIVGSILLTPNIVSLVDYKLGPFDYATNVHGATSLADSLWNCVKYLGEGVLYMIGTIAAFVLLARPSGVVWRDIMWPAGADRRLMTIALVTSILAPIPVSVLLQVNLTPLWTMPFWSLLPVLLLASPHLEIPRRATAVLLAAAFLVPLVAVAAAPAVALVKLKQGVPNSQMYFLPLAREVDRLWPMASGSPLRYVTGNGNLAWSCAFYCRDHPQALPDYSAAQAPWIDPAAMARDGFIALCEASDRACVAGAHARAAGTAGVVDHDVEVDRSMFGVRAEPRGFIVTVVPAHDR